MSEKYPGGIITKSPVTPTGPYAEGTAPGIWKLNEVAYWVQQGLWPNASNPAPNDPYFQYVTSLLHGDGTNGGQNNTFLDSSTNAFTITRNGNTTQGSFSPYGSNWGNYFNASNLDNLNFSNGSNFAFGTGDYTIEFWINGPLNSDRLILDFRSGGSGNGFVIVTGSGSGNTAGCLRYSGANDATSGSVVITNGQWNHCAVVRSSGTINLYVNGIYTGTCSDSTNYSSTSGTIYIGHSSYSNSYNLTAYLSNLRIVKGAALYTANFTPSTTPLTTTVSSGTVSLLTCQSNRFVDNSGNSVSLSVTGTPQVTRFSPFAPTYATQYSASTIGGSGYWDGSGDYLQTSSSFSGISGTGDYTIRGWFYFNDFTTGADASGFLSVYGQGASHPTYPIAVSCKSGYFVVVDSGNFGSSWYSTWNYSGSYANAFAAKQWVYMNIYRQSGTLYIYANGLLQLSVSQSSSSPSKITDPMLGRFYAGDTASFQGYVSDFQILNNANTTSTPSSYTSPATAISGTQLLLSMQNGAIYDSSEVADYETVGNAQISTSVKKYGTGSVYFDGNGDSMKAAASSTFKLSGNFTIEGWVYPTGLNNELDIFCIGNQNSGGLLFYNQSSTQKWRLYSGAEILISSITASNNTWYHFAISRAGSLIKLFINGTQVASATNSSTFDGSSGSGIVVGGSYDGTFTTSPGAFYLDDLRVTNGYARYWENFAPPTTALPNIGTSTQPTQDPQFNYTTLLLPGNGTNGAQNNTFLDSSTNAFTLTRTANVTQGTFTPFSQTGWSNYFNGSSADTGEYVPAGSAFAYGTGDFTVECWFYMTSLPSYGTQLLAQTVSGTNYFLCRAGTGEVSSQPKLEFRFGTSGGGTAITASNTFQLNTWNHAAFVRSSGTVYVYLNGTLNASGACTQDFNNTTYNPTIGRSSHASENLMTGYISNMRVVKGTAVYTSNFTPSTTPLTAISGTSLLTCQSNRFVDNSGNNFTVTPIGTPTVQAFSPFAPTAAYSASTVGGSGYFDTSDTYLTAPDSTAWDFGTGDFTIECWVYPTSLSSTMTPLSQWDGANGFALQWNSSDNSVRLYNGSTQIATSSTSILKVNQWHHLVAVRSGTTIRVYVNGSGGSSVSSATNFSGSGDPLYIGALSASTQNYYGYISGVRIVKGSAVYDPSSSTLTVPTAPPTAITNTQLLVNFTNAGIADATAKNDLQTVGNAQISTTQSKFGGSSLKFDGSGDYLQLTSTPALQLGAGDFTVEGWFYANSPVPTYGYKLYTQAWSGTNYFLITVGNAAGSGNVISTIINGTTISSTATFTTGTWNHFAVVRYNGYVTIYLNGVGSTPTSNTTDLNNLTYPIGIGSYTHASSEQYNGYLQDFRITKGYARYVQNFTPPTQADQLY